MADRVHASIVVPSFNEAASLPLLGERLRPVLDGHDFDWEVLIVDDGSTDASYAEIEKLHDSDPRFKCLRFSRNFGSHIAISAGLEHCFGDLAIVVTADLEEPPEAVPEFLGKWREGYHVVWGIRAARPRRGASAIGSYLFHRIFAWLAEQGPGQSEIGGGFFLVDGKVLDTIRRFQERNRNLIGLLLWAGFKQTRLTYKPAPRRFGTSKWTFAKKIRLALDTFVGFSSRPLRSMLGAGVASVLIGLLAIGGFATGLASGAGHTGVLAPVGVVGAVALIVGVQLLASGLLGEYVARALDESRARPLYVVLERLGLGEPHEEAARRAGAGEPGAEAAQRSRVGT